MSLFQQAAIVVCKLATQRAQRSQSPKTGSYAAIAEMDLAEAIDAAQLVWLAIDGDSYRPGIALFILDTALEFGIQDLDAIVTNDRTLELKDLVDLRRAWTASKITESKVLKSSTQHLSQVAKLAQHLLDDVNANIALEISNER